MRKNLRLLPFWSGTREMNKNNSTQQNRRIKEIDMTTTINHHLTRGHLALKFLRWGTGAGMALAALPALAADPDTLAVDTMAHDLDGVTVTAQRKLIKADIDKLTYDVANDETARTKNTLDMLRSVPLVAVDGQENITIKGSKAFKVYRNGHPDPTLSSQNLKDVLKAIPAIQIKKVEVITEPGAKEDAEGTQYILNIVMKDNSGMSGVTGNVNSTYDFFYKSPSVGGMLMTQKGKFAASINYGFKHMEQEQRTENETYYVRSGNTLAKQTHSTPKMDMHYGNLNASYEIDSLNLLTMSFGGYYYKMDMGTTPFQALMTNSSGQTVYSFNGFASTPEYNMYNLGGRMDYQHKTHRAGEVLTASYQLQMSRSHQDTEQRYTEYVNLPVSYTGLSNNTYERFLEHTFQLDYVRPLGKLLVWNVGTKYILRTNKSDAQLDYTGAEAMDEHSLFDHNTQVAAAYTEWVYRGSKLQARAGLRYEHSFMKGKYPDGSHPNFDKRLNDWVPSASVRYAWTESQSVKLSFATSINRPGISYLNPTQNRQPTTLNYGNPKLNSSRDYNLQLQYNYVSTKFTFMGGISHSFSNNGISEVKFDQDGVQVTTIGDLLHNRSWTFWAYIQASPWKGASISGGPNIFKQTYKDGGNGLKHSRWYSWYTLNFTQKLPWKLTFGINGGFNIGRQVNSVYDYQEPSHYWSSSISRPFLKNDRLTVTLRANNLFGPHLQPYRSHTVEGDFRGYSTWMGSQKSVSISVSWSFGKLKGGVKEVERTIKNDDLKGGISAGTGMK